jgi:hypothetical protein
MIERDSRSVSATADGRRMRRPAGLGKFAEAARHLGLDRVALNEAAPAPTGV